MFLSFFQKSQNGSWKDDHWKNRNATPLRDGNIYILIFYHFKNHLNIFPVLRNVLWAECGDAQTGKSCEPNWFVENSIWSEQKKREQILNSPLNQTEAHLEE